MESSASPPERLQRGVIWGKDVKHFEQRIDLLRFAADIVPLISTASRVFSHQNIEWLGHQSSASWRQLLRSSKFLLGLGDPLLGPSAIDAVTAGCMFLNPRYQREVKGVSFDSQHPYAVQKIGEPYICSFDIHSQEQLRVCIDKALATTLTPLIPADFTEENYLKRVEAIFNL